MQNKSTSSKALLVKGYTLGALTAVGLLAVLLARWQVAGTPVPPALSTARFSVAILAGPKQAAQTAPENTDQVAEAVTTTPEPISEPVVAAERDTSLPEAVQAAQQSTPSEASVTQPVEVLPPAEVSMPGGQLMAQDATIGNSTADPFALTERQVFIRLLVNAQGKVVRFGIIRGGGDPMRDSLILKAMRSRTYATDKLIRIEGSEPLWQLDMVLDYGNNDFLP